MLTRYTKERLSRPKLSIVDESKIPPEPELMKSLKFLEEDELPLDYNYSGSDISDPFEDPHKPKIEKDLKKARKKFSKLENDYKLMNSFSEEFKKSMAEVRKEMQISTNMSYEDMSQIDKTLKTALTSTHISEELKEEIEKILKDEENLNIGPEYEIQEREAKDPTEYDAMSGMWRMLNASKDLVVSPLGYDAQRQRTPHWLDAPGTSWEDMDQSKFKCEIWMKTQLTK